ncbi:hypothetical protein GIB67_027967 [Kingdonia uniflora]|uniref:Uncharacterized protein n=1 Tax=Kingdonia uniflora TaxID=39325 RepID=A0A7J7LGX1_9MAGN|nr:hypothetical protein GIB67_027967 [Kingdonia uniflora]
MDFFKVKKFRKAHKPNVERDLGDEPVLLTEEVKIENNKVDSEIEVEEEEEDDDDFIEQEVKRRLKELRNKSCMSLIPEDSCLKEDEEGRSSSDWRGSEIEDQEPPCHGFDELYGNYCERMLFFDRVSAQQLQEAGSRVPSNQSPKSASKKLVSTLRNLSFKKREGILDGGELLEQQQHDDPFQDLETAYVAHICLTWEALHCQYKQLRQRISSQSDDDTCYSHAAQQFQQFQVLLQRFIENEPFEKDGRVEIFARSRKSLPKLLQVPSIQDADNKRMGEEESDYLVPASDLISIMEDSILTFRVFLKMDNRKSGTVLNLFGGRNQIVSPLQHTQSSLEKKEMKLKEIFKKKKAWKKKSWPTMWEEVDILFGLIDVKVITRALKMAGIKKEQLLWCEDKLSKLNLSENRLKRDGFPILFPC